MFNRFLNLFNLRDTRYIELGHTNLDEPQVILTKNSYGTYSQKNLPLIKQNHTALAIKCAEVFEQSIAVKFSTSGTSSLLWQTARHAAKNLTQDQIAALPEDIQKVIEATKIAPTL